MTDRALPELTPRRRSRLAHKLALAAILIIAAAAVGLLGFRLPALALALTGALLPVPELRRRWLDAVAESERNFTWP